MTSEPACPMTPSESSIWERFLPNSERDKQRKSGFSPEAPHQQLIPHAHVYFPPDEGVSYGHRAPDGALFDDYPDNDLEYDEDDEEDDEDDAHDFDMPSGAPAMIFARPPSPQPPRLVDCVPEYNPAELLNELYHRQNKWLDAPLPIGQPYGAPVYSVNPVNLQISPELESSIGSSYAERDLEMVDFDTEPDVYPSPPTPEKSEPTYQAPDYPPPTYDLGGTYEKDVLWVPEPVGRGKVHAQSPQDNTARPPRRTMTRKKSSPAGVGGFVCELSLPGGGPCNKAFTRPYDLSRHQETIHAAVRKLYRCDHCGSGAKTFSRLDALSRHLRIKHSL